MAPHPRLGVRLLGSLSRSSKPLSEFTDDELIAARDRLNRLRAAKAARVITGFPHRDVAIEQRALPLRDRTLSMRVYRPVPHLGALPISRRRLCLRDGGTDPGAGGVGGLPARSGTSVPGLDAGRVRRRWLRERPKTPTTLTPTSSTAFRRIWLRDNDPADPLISPLLTSDLRGVARPGSDGAL
jgi:hypothetical protein